MIQRTGATCTTFGNPESCLKEPQCPDFVERPIPAPVQSFNTRGTCVRSGSSRAPRIQRHRAS